MYLKNITHCIDYIGYMTCMSKVIDFSQHSKLSTVKYISGIFSCLYVYDYNFIKHIKHNSSSEYNHVAEYNLLLYEYIKIETNNGQYNLYRIPHTFTIAYNDTYLISASMRTNLYYLYWLLECKDVMRVITENLYNVVKYDYSLYICAN